MIGKAYLFIWQLNLTIELLENEYVTGGRYTEEKRERERDACSVPKFGTWLATSSITCLDEIVASL